MKRKVRSPPVMKRKRGDKMYKCTECGAVTSKVTFIGPTYEVHKCNTCGMKQLFPRRVIT